MVDLDGQQEMLPMMQSARAMVELKRKIMRKRRSLGMVEMRVWRLMGSWRNVIIEALQLKSKSQAVIQSFNFKLIKMSQ